MFHALPGAAKQPSRAASRATSRGRSAGMSRAGASLPRQVAPWADDTGFARRLPLSKAPPPAVPSPAALWFWAETAVPPPALEIAPPPPGFMRASTVVALVLAALLTLLFLAGCGAEAPQDAETGEPIDAALTADARSLLAQASRPGSGLHYDGSLLDAIEFFRPHEGGNGRSCATCHRPEDQFGLTPQTVEARWQKLQERRRTDPSADDPLFRAIDADDFANDFTTLRTKALVRVTVPLATNVKRADDATAPTTSVWRAVPTVVNARFSAPYQFDGREATLDAQARAAIRNHSQVTGEPAQGRVERIVRFQQHLSSSLRVARLAQELAAGNTTPAPVDRDLDAQEQRGRKTFEKFCATCHGGPTQTRNTDGRFLPVFARGPRGQGGEDFVNVFVSTPRPPPPGLPAPVTTPRFFDGRPTAGLADTVFRVTLPTGATVTTTSSDGGRGLITGDLREFGRFDVPTLYGIARTAPYFHDNSARDLDAVIAQYQAMFKFLQFLDEQGGFFAPLANGQGCAAGTCGFAPIPDNELPALKAYLMQLGL